MRSGIVLVIILICPAQAWADAHQPAPDQDLPSEAMLEFLGDLEPVDDETWQLLEHHALKDSTPNQEVNSE